MDERGMAEQGEYEASIMMHVQLHASKTRAQLVAELSGGGG